MTITQSAAAIFWKAASKPFTPVITLSMTS